ncbi:hypothetical protein VA7868_00251 [Vibrio aerogenes CECT 7868]|uniref:DUF1203 domain-containing protein n=1 Tax=Vibrio aerogenes CECT 7868 TaxID=1216006 RepID=A0A1M5V3W6_9VIBR|nr:DUF1203 domain-containing protein [Vibrio aerogenes]SHH69643.1 hypothetical protein VA7868_00251 [Vibrio aerogenes CECT 7868]
MITITPVRPDFLAKARQAGLDDQNQPVEHLIAEGGEPCRDTLRRAQPGEKLILGSYCPFSRPGPYKEYGPIFIQAEPADTPPDLTRLPTRASTGPAYLSHMFVLRAYRENETIATAGLVSTDNAQAVLEQFFTDPEVHFVLARFAAYGCYALRLDREITGK